MQATEPNQQESAPPAAAAWSLPGMGLLKGLAVTGANMLQSFYRKDRMTTIQYPEQQAAISPNFRNFPFLVYDGDDPIKGLRCTACSICENECPPQCIYIVKDVTKKPDYIGKLQFQPKVFDIDISVCMSCQICVEVCPFDAIKMDVEFELSTGNRFDQLLLRKGDLAKSNSYYHQIHAEEAAEVDGRLAVEKARAEAKTKAAAAKSTTTNPQAATLPAPVQV